MNKLNDKELLELLKTDVQAFNVYREECPNQNIDFSDSDLNCLDINADNFYLNLSYINFQNSTFKFAKIKNVNLEGSNIRNCNFSFCNLQNSNLKNVKAEFADFHGSNLSESDLEGGFFYKANFRFCNLNYADFRSAKIKKSYLFKGKKSITIRDKYVNQEGETTYYTDINLIKFTKDQIMYFNFYKKKLFYPKVFFIFNWEWLFGLSWFAPFFVFAFLFCSCNNIYSNILFFITFFYSCKLIHFCLVSLGNRDLIEAYYNKPKKYRKYVKKETRKKFLLKIRKNKLKYR